MNFCTNLLAIGCKITKYKGYSRKLSKVGALPENLQARNISQRPQIQSL